MATLRTAGPSVATIFRFSAQPAVATNRCAHCLKAQRCPFSSFQPRRQAAKRPLMTESTYRPHKLNPELLSPKSGEISEIGGLSAPQQKATWPPSAPWANQEAGKNLGLQESESQIRKPVVTPAEASASITPKPATQAAAAPKKSKLRPRKAPIKLTPLAVEQLRGLFNQPDSKLIRIGVKNRGCSGLAYHLEYVDKPGAFDETVEQDGVKVLIDSKALFSIIGSEMDWLEDKLSARFIFRNPNITEQCGCGESFSIS